MGGERQKERQGEVGRGRAGVAESKAVSSSLNQKPSVIIAGLTSRVSGQRRGYGKEGPGFGVEAWRPRAPWGAGREETKSKTAFVALQDGVRWI